MRVASFLILGLLQQEPPAPAAAGAVVGGAEGGAAPFETTLRGIHPWVERRDPARAGRMAEQRSLLEAQLAAMEKCGGEAEWIAAAKKLYDEWGGMEREGPGFVAAGDWVLTSALLDAIVWGKGPLPPDKRAPLEDGRLDVLLMVADLDRQFAAQGIDFLVVTVPSKLAIYPEILLPEAKRDGFAGMGSVVAKLLLELNREGVETLSLTREFVAARHPADAKEDLLFLKSDPHWTVRGAELGARHVAERVAQYPWFKRGPIAEGKHYEVADEEVPYSAGGEMASRGSRDETMRGNVVKTRKGEPYDALDPRSPILVFGDSFVRVHRERAADFVTHLCRFTGWKIDCLFAVNGGQRQVHQKLERRAAAQWKGKRLAIWLVPEQITMPRSKLEPAQLFGEEAEGDGK